MARCVEEPREEWLNLWKSGYCYSYFYNLLYNSPGEIRLSPSGLEETEVAMLDVFTRYLEENSLTLPGKPGYNPVQEDFYSLCSKLPGACDLALNKVCSKYTRAEIESSPVLLDFCGCYAPPLTGELGRLLTRDGVYDRPCDPLCSRIGVIKRLKPKSDGEPDLCRGDVCVINDVSLKIRNSALPYVSFNQVCTCKERCSCIFDSTNIGGMLQKLGLNYTISQFCPAEALCLERRGEISQSVPCKATPVSFPLSTTFYIVLAVIVVVLVLLGIVYVIFSKL